MNQSGDTHNEQGSTTVFSAAELSRLSTYRAAILAGFYTDNCSQTPHMASDSSSLALVNMWLKEAIV